MYSPHATAGYYPSVPPPAVSAAAPGEEYKHRVDNPFYQVQNTPLSTFSVDVDTASYSIVRRMLLQEKRLPPPDAVRIEEMINYFSYNYPAAKDAPINVSFDSTAAPWSSGHQLVRIGVQAKQIQASKVGPRNLVFLLDVSGSMMPANRLPMVKQAMKLLVDQLDAADTVAIVVYAGASGLALPPTPGSHKGEILAALNRLEAGGGTNGGQGIKLAYETARKSFKNGGVNRVILATDGDFNLGTTSEAELTRLIEEERKSNVFLTVLGVGEGNLKDARMEMLADKGNGNYAYLDTLDEARKVLVQQAGSTLVTVAKDVKLQVEFNPEKVVSYRLIGYENRVLDARDFKDDRKDAGDMGAGHTVTALYEIVPKQPGVAAPPADIDPLKYQSKTASAVATGSNEWMTVKVRYKQPEGDSSSELVFPYSVGLSARIDPNTILATAVAELGMLLRDASAKGEATYEQVLAQLDRLDRDGQPDPEGLRAELRKMVEQARTLSGGKSIERVR